MSSLKIVIVPCFANNSASCLVLSTAVGCSFDSVISISSLFVHPLLPLTITLYVPSSDTVILSSVDCVFHKYEIANVLCISNLMLACFSLISVASAIIVTVGAVLFSLIVVDVVFVQPLEDVAVTV